MYVIKTRPAPDRKIAVKQSFHSCQTRVFSHSVLLSLLFASVTALGVSGCGGVVILGGSPGSNTTDAPSLAATPATVDFGSVGIGNSANQKISLANKGSDSVQISQLSLSNTAFRVDGVGKLPVTLASGSTMSLTVHFSPNSSSDSSDQLGVITSASSTPATTIKLHGKGSSTSIEINGMTCDEAKVTGAASESCTIVTNVAAPSSGLQVQLSSNTSAIKVPASVTVPAGASSVKFVATVSKVSADQTGVITATQGSAVKSFSISLSPPTTAVGTPELKSFSCANTSFTGAEKTACTVSLSATSSRALTVTLASTSSAVAVPASAAVPAGSKTASFTANVAAVGKAQTATISATENGSSRSVSMQLNASNTSAAALSLSTSSLQFGDVSVGTAVTKSVTLTSSGNVPLTVKSDAITGAGFSVSGGNLPSSLKPGDALVLTVHFNPTSAGSATGQLAVSSNAGNQLVSLSGNGATTTPTLSSLSCSSSSIVGTLADSCKVSLSGSAPKGGVTVSLASSSTNVKVPAIVVIPATATTATFSADAAAVSTAQSVKLTATAGSASTSISLQLSPVSAQLSVDATTISFGAIALNQLTTEVVTLTSVGKAAVTVKSLSVSGTGFSLSPVSLPATLNPGQTLLLTLVYKATTTGSQTGQLTIISNSSTSPTLTVRLSATSTPHHVELNWNAPADPSQPVSGYKVYRAIGGTGSFAKIAVTGQTTYTDTNVQSGDTYKYYVTSLGSSGGESKPSNTFTAKIP
jgi:hypothetical protein